MLAIKVGSATLPMQLPACPGNCRQRSYPKCTSQWLA